MADTLKYWHNGHPIILSSVTAVANLKYWDSAQPYVMIPPPPPPPSVYKDVSLRSVYNNLSDNLKLLYDFSETGSLLATADNSANQRTGNVSGSNTTAMWTAGGTGGLNCDGTNDHVDIAGTDIFSAHTIGSVEMWVDILELDRLQSLFNYSKSTDNLQHFNIQLQADNSFKVVIGAGTDFLTSNNAITDTGIYHILLTNDGTTIKFYLNSVLQDITWSDTAKTLWFADLTGANTITLGNYMTNGADDHYANTTYYKFAVYDIALTQSQITKIFRNERLLFDSDIRPTVPIPNPGRSTTNVQTGLIFQDI